MARHGILGRCYGRANTLQTASVIFFNTTLTSTIQDIAAAIAGRHRRRERFQSVRGLVGSDLRLAYDVQDRVIQELAGDASARENAAGYKIGLTTPRMQTM